jgi:transaldolase
MKFFIDTADLEQIQEAKKMGILDGVTTNPTLMMKAGIKCSVDEHYTEICSITSGPVSAEVLSLDHESMIEEGKRLAELADNIVVKVPMTEEGLIAIRYFSMVGIKTNCTLIFSAAQALAAAKAGATYVSPFVGRLDDIGEDGTQLIRDIREMFDRYPSIDTYILAASIRNVNHVTECAKAGADVMTAPLSVFKDMLKHPLTDKGMEQFIKDSENLK